MKFRQKRKLNKIHNVLIKAWRMMPAQADLPPATFTDIIDKLGVTSYREPGGSLYLLYHDPAWSVAVGYCIGTKVVGSNPSGSWKLLSITSKGACIESIDIPEFIKNKCIDVWYSAIPSIDQDAQHYIGKYYLNDDDIPESTGILLA